MTVHFWNNQNLIICTLTISHVITKYQRMIIRACKKSFVQKFINLLLKKFYAPNKKREKIFDNAEWLNKLCAGLPKWEPPGRKIMVRL